MLIILNHYKWHNHGEISLMNHTYYLYYIIIILLCSYLKTITYIPHISPCYLMVVGYPLTMDQAQLALGASAARAGAHTVRYEA